jgi:glycosyltransferase involved in cell wall biosynthesis
MTNLQDANNLFKAGRYSEAIRMYEGVIAQSPQLEKICSFNLNLAKKRAIQEVDASTLLVKSEDPKKESQRYLHDLYIEVADVISKIEHYEIKDQPLVSVLMTSHNIEDYVAEAVTSVLRQSYSNIEVIIVDDNSSDKTRSILERLRRASPKVKIKFLNTNLGTYYAKNIGFQMSKGEYIFFQDCDDICHPERIKLSMLSMLKDGVVGIRGAYSRVLYPQGLVLNVNNLYKKLGLITTGYKRSVFQDIGYFNCTSKASDEEFFNRARLYYGRQKIIDVNLPLYYNTFREGSLFADMIGNDPALTNTIEQIPSESRVQYAAEFNKIHQSLEKQQFKEFFKFPVLRDLIPVKQDMTYLSNPKVPVVANICTYPPRVKSFKVALESIIPQVDEINIYLDKYEEVPEFLKQLPIKANIYTNKDFANLRDNGKLIGLSNLKTPCYYFTIDDDIIYPPDYVHALIKKIELYDRKVVVGVHGVLIPEMPKSYYSSFRMVYTFWKKLEKDSLVNNLGTGTAAFYSDLLPNLKHSDLEHAGMLDIYFSIYCKKNNIPMVSIERHDDWMSEVKQDSADVNLFQEFKDHDDKQSKLVAENMPWGYQAIQAALEETSKKASPEIIQKLKQLIPIMHQVSL